jgi:hypothetical protein
MKDRKIAISKAQEALVELKSQLNTLQSEFNSNNSSVVTISTLMRTQLKKLVDILLPNLDDINLKKITDLLDSNVDMVAYYHNLIELNQVDVNRIQSIRSQSDYPEFENELKSINSRVAFLLTEANGLTNLVSRYRSYKHFDLVLIAAKTENWMNSFVNWMTGKKAKVQLFLDMNQFKSIEDFNTQYQENNSRAVEINKEVNVANIRSSNIIAIKANEKKLVEQVKLFEEDKDSKVKYYIISVIETLPNLDKLWSYLTDDNRVLVSSIIAFRNKLEILQLAKITLRDEISDREKCIKSINDSLKKWKQSSSKTLQQDQTNRLINSPTLRRKRTNAIHASTSKLRTRVDDFNDYEFYDLNLEADNVLPFWVLLFPEQDFINPLMLKNLIPDFDPDIIEFPNFDCDDSQYDSPQDSPPDDGMIDFDWSQPIDSTMDNVSDSFVGSDFNNDLTSTIDVGSWFDTSSSIDTSSYGGMD